MSSPESGKTHVLYIQTIEEHNAMCYKTAFLIQIKKKTPFCK